MQEYTEFASAKLCVHCGLGKPTPGQIKAGSELRSAWKQTYGLAGNRMRTTQILASCSHGARLEDLSGGNELEEKYTQH